MTINQDKSLRNDTESSSPAGSFISLQDVPAAKGAAAFASPPRDILLSVENLTLRTPNGRVTLVNDLDLEVVAAEGLKALCRAA
jgi:hypothetical protein